MDPQQDMPLMTLPPTDPTGAPDPLNTAGTTVPPTAAVTADTPQLPQAVQQDDTAATSVNAPLIADDVDLIEKEWVNKIQEIINHTHGDPYERARQLALIKSEYLQKRYQKSVKLA